MKINGMSSARTIPNMDDVLTVKSLSNGGDTSRQSSRGSKSSATIVNGDSNSPSVGKNNSTSAVVRARLDSCGDVCGVNRFKYHAAPYSGDNGRLVLPMRANLVSAPLKPTTPILEEWVEKKPLDISLRSGSSGYHSSTRSSSRVRAISDRLYNPQHNRASNRCSPLVDHSSSSDSAHRSPITAVAVVQSRANGFGESPPATGHGSSLPDIDTGDVRLSVSASSDRSKMVTGSRRRSPSPSKRSSATISTPAMTILINIEKKGNGMREIRDKLVWRGDKLRQEIEEKLKHVQLRHERAMRILRDQQRLEKQILSGNRPQSIDRPHPIAPNPPRLPAHPLINGSRGFVRRSRYPKTRTVPIQTPVDHHDRAGSVPEEVETDQSATVSTLDSPSISADTTPCSMCGNHKQPRSICWPTTADRTAWQIDLVDSPLVDKDIIKPLIDAVLRESISSLSVFRANETVALGIVDANAIYDDVEHFLYNEVIPGAVKVAAFTSPPRK